MQGGALNGGRTLLTMIRDTYGALAPAEKRVADLVLNFPGELAGYSASELAGMAETSNAAVSRFVRRLGFANFDEMRRLAREEREAGSPLFLLEKSFDSDGPDAIDRHLDSVTDNLRKTVAALDRAAFAGFVEATARAPQVWIAGFRHGYSMAGYLHWSMAHARGAVRLLPRAGETFGESLIDLSAGDVLIVFAMRRRVPAVSMLVRTASGRGARVAVVTDPGYVATDPADWIFRCESRSRGPIDDHASALVFSHLVCEALIAKLGKAARTRLGAIDDLHESLNEL